MCNPPLTHGTLSFDGQDLHIEDPAPGYPPAVLSADAELYVLVDQHPLHEPTSVFTQSQIQFFLPTPEPPQYSFDFNIEPFFVDLTANQHAPGVIFTLSEHQATAHLHLRMHKREVGLDYFEAELWEDVQRQLRHQKVHQPILKSAFLEALRNPGQVQRILETPPPLHPYNRLNFLYELPLPTAEGLALAFPALERVKAGTVLVERALSTKSRAGMTVYGEVLPPHEVIAPELKAADRSVRLDIDRNHAIAMIEGLPVFDAEAGIKMSGVLKQESAILGGPGHIVDLKSSLQLASHIRDRARVWVKDYLEVAEDIGHSEVDVEAGLIVHGSIVRSVIRVGGDAAARMALCEPVLELVKNMNTLLHMVKEVRSRAPQSRTTDDKTLFLRVIKTQFTGFDKAVETLWELNKSLKQLHPRRTMALKVVLSHLMNMSERPLTERLFVDWLKGLQDFAQELVSLPAQANHVYLSYAQGATITTRGHLFVTGEGCYNSHLSAGQHVVFLGAPGYCREGSLKAEGHVFVPELGSPNGSRLKVEVRGSSCIYANVLHAGVELRFGDAPAYHVLNTQSQVLIRQEHGETVFLPLQEPLHTYYLPFFSKEF